MSKKRVGVREVVRVGKAKHTEGQRVEGTERREDVRIEEDKPRKK